MNPQDNCPRYEDIIPENVTKAIDVVLREARNISRIAAVKLDSFIPFEDNGQNLKLFTDRDMILMFHEGVKWARAKERIV